MKHIYIAFIILINTITLCDAKSLFNKDYDFDIFRTNIIEGINSKSKVVDEWKGIENLRSLEGIENLNNVHIVLSLQNCPGLQAKLDKTIDKLSQNERSAIEQALASKEKVKELVTKPITATTDIDMAWTAYSITGDSSYIRRVLESACSDPLALFLSYEIKNRKILQKTLENVTDPVNLNPETKKLLDCEDLKKTIKEHRDGPVAFGHKVVLTSYAYWSLTSNEHNYDDVRQAVATIIKDDSKLDYGKIITQMIGVDPRKDSKVLDVIEL